MTTSEDERPGVGSLVRLPHPVVLTGIVLVAVQVGVRAWASAGSWFLADDFSLMSRLYRVPLTLAELFTPYDSQLMPGGIFSAWLVANAGPQNWTAAASIIIGLQAIASASCLLMLVTVFGRRWAILPLLLVYLASPLTLTAYMWWAAAINQVPLHAAFFLTVTCAVLYFRTRRRLWLCLTFAAVLLGMAFYVKAVLFLPVVAAVAFLFFTPPAADEVPSGVGLAARWRASGARTLRAFAPFWLALLVLGAAYTALYVGTVDNPLEGYDVQWAPLADNVLRLSLGPALVGGPWHWWNPIAPVGLVDPPSWAVTATWAGLVLTAYALHQRGGARWRALIIPAGYLGATFFLLAVGRASVVGPVAGLELRYLADATPVLVLALGLLLLEARRPLDSPRTVPAVPRDAAARRLLAWPIAMCLVLVAGAGLSTIRYVAFWHDDYQAKVYTRNVAQAASMRDLDVVDVWVPQNVVSPLRFPDNYVSRVFRPLPGVRASTSGTDLQIIDDLGVPRRAEVVPGVASPPGPIDGCGYAVKGGARTIPLEVTDEADPLESSWWIEIDYLASEDGVVTATVGGTEVEVPVMQGLHQYLTRGEGPIDEVVLDTGRSDLGLCVDKVIVGKVQAWDESS